MTDLISIVLTLTAARGAILPAEEGRANYAETLARLARDRPALAATLHEANGPKPLTCSGLLGEAGGGPTITIRPGETYTVRVTGLTEEVSAALAEVLLRRPPRQWQLGGCCFDVVQVTCDPAQHPWAGQTSYRDLLLRYTGTAEGNGQRTVTLEFASPTAFRSQAMQLPLPLPGLVFGSLAERWNAFARLPLGCDVRAFAEQAVGISRYRLESVSVPAKNGGLRIGGVGVATYRVLSDDPLGVAAVSLLADFALYAGVGVQTTSGMGQCRRVE